MNRTSLKLSNEAKFKLAVHTALLAGFSTAASAQPPAPAPAPAQTDEEKATELETLQVTGSRLPAPGLVAVSPVATVTAEEVTFQGVTRAEDLLNQMPQVFAGQGAYLANGATGTATVDLRGLGSARTLVMIDGKRLMPGDPSGGASSADLNHIPTPLIDRVELLTGGASAVYGSDALAGVVNFFMKRDFEGVRFNYQHSYYQHNNDDDDAVSDAVRRRLAAGGSATEFRIPDSNVVDGERNILSAVIGMNSADGRGNATAYATYQTVNAVEQGQRTFSECALRADIAADRFSCSGSSTNATGRFTDFATFNFTVVPTATPGVGGFRNFSGARDQFNFNPYNYFQRNDERWGLGVFAHYEVNDQFDVYTDIMYMDDRTDAVIAPSGSFFVDVTTACNNPLIGNVDPDGAGPQVSQLAGVCGGSTAGSSTFYLARRNVEGGGRDDDLRHTAIRGILGTRGELAEGVNYDVYGQYGQVLLSEIYRKDFSIQRIRRAIDVVTDPATGQPACRSAVDGTDTACVPWNIWAPGGVSDAALDYLQVPGFRESSAVEYVVHTDVSSDLGRFGVRLPGATDGLSVLIGAEYRSEEVLDETDQAFESGDLAGQGGPRIGTQGGFELNEVFTEARLPFVQDRPGVDNLFAEVGYRYSSYSTAGTSDTYKFAINYAPVKDITGRIAFNRAVRAPNVGELSTPLAVLLDGNTDPCAGAAPDATLAQCLNDPVIAANPALYGTIPENPAAQYNGLQGSSPSLAPETGDSWTYGLVFTPTFVKDLSVTLDYFDIEIEGLISQIGADTILEECYFFNNLPLCSAIMRDGVGSLWITGFVVDPIQNTGSLATKGFDLAANYELRLPAIGELDFDFNGTHVIDYDVQPIPGGRTFGCDGLYGIQCGTPTPRWRHKFRTTWSLPMVDVSAQWRYLSEVTADATTFANTISNDRTLDEANYLDLAFSVPFMGQYKFTGGIQNVTDVDPPAINQAALPSVSGSGNTFPQVYDTLGRYVFLGFNMDF